MEEALHLILKALPWPERHTGMALLRVGSRRDNQSRGPRQMGEMSSCMKCRVPIERLSSASSAELCSQLLFKLDIAKKDSSEKKQLLLLLESSSCVCVHLIRPNTGSVAQQQKLYTQTGNGLGLSRFLLVYISIIICFRKKKNKSRWM